MTSRESEPPPTYLLVEIEIKMADGNYDEVTNTVYLGESRENIDPMFHWDLHFPERVSRLRISPEFSSPVSRRQRRTRDRCAVRYKTQPITFDEITEVDEDASGGGQSAVSGQAISGSGAVAPPEVQQEVTPEMKINFKKAMTGFSRSMDGLVLGGGGGGGGGGSGKTGSGSDKENTPCGGGGDALPEVAKPETGSDNQKSSTSGPDSIRSTGRSLDGVHRKRMHRKSYNRNTVEEVPETEIAKVEETE